ncbi:MAG TPA: hypothetical protein VKB14_03235 [Actinomycetales bacterium]|nr:hypothetical protein [Actinomycetales bacterium]
MKQDLRNDLASSGFLDRVGEDHVFLTLPTAVAAYIRYHTDHHGHEPVGIAIPPPPSTPMDRRDR